MLPRAAGRVTFAAIALLLCARVAIVAWAWHGYAAEVAEVATLADDVPPGSKVLIARVDPDKHPVWWHSVKPGRRIIGFGEADDYLPVLLLMHRGAFTPLLFADPSQQPVSVRADYAALTVLPVGDPPDYHLLRAQQALPKFPYLQDWTQRFDMLLVIGADGAPDLESALPDNLRLIAKVSTAALFKAEHRAHKVELSAAPDDPAARPLQR